MERSATVEVCIEPLAIPAGDLACPVANPLDKLLPAPDRRAAPHVECGGDESDELLGFFLEDEIDKSSLNLRPFVPLASAEAGSILVEGLVEDYDHKQWLVPTSRCDLCQSLKKLYVAAPRILGGILQDLSGLVD